MTSYISKNLKVKVNTIKAIRRTGKSQKKKKLKKEKL